MSTGTGTGPELDTRRAYYTWRGYPSPGVRYDKASGQMVAPVAVGEGKEKRTELQPVEDAGHLTIHLQDGAFYAENKQRLGDGEVPKILLEWRGRIPRTPGITHAAAIVYECQECHAFAATYRRQFEGHLRAHGLSGPAMQEALARYHPEVRERMKTPWDEADFAGPPAPVPDYSGGGHGEERAG